MIRSFFTTVLCGFFFVQSADACPMADAAAFQTAAEKVAQAQGSKATFVLSGLTCGSCSEKVASTLNGTEGVILSAVDYQTGRVEIAFDPAKTDVAKLETALVGTGYTIQQKPS